MKTPLIIAATKDEIAPLLKALGCASFRRKEGLKIYSGRLLQTDLTVVISGMGVANARRAADFLTFFAPRWVLIPGAAGALDPTLQSGQLLWCTSVSKLAEKGTWKSPLVDRLPQLPLGLGLCQAHLVSAPDLVTTPAAKAIVANQSGAQLVDLETATLVQRCTELKIPWIGLRYVSDDANSALPTALNWLVRADEAQSKIQTLLAMILLTFSSSPFSLWQLRSRVRHGAVRLEALMREVISVF